MHNALRERWDVYGAEYLPLRGYRLHGLDLRDAGVYDALREWWDLHGAERVHLCYGLHGRDLPDAGLHNAVRE